MKTTSRRTADSSKLSHDVKAKRTKTEKRSATEKVASKPTSTVAPRHHKDGNDAANTRSKAFDAKAGAGVEIARTPAHESATTPLYGRINKALDELGVRVGMRVQPYNAGDWMDYAHSKKADRAVQVFTLGETEHRYVLEEKKDPDRLVLMNESETDTRASVLISDFPSFTAAVQAALAGPLATAQQIRDGLLAPRPQHSAPAATGGARPLTSERRQLLEAEVRQLSQDVSSLRHQVSDLSRGYGYTRPWAMDQSRSEFTMVNGRFDVLGYDRHVRQVTTDQQKYDALSQQLDHKSGQLDLKTTELRTGLASNVD